MWIECAVQEIIEVQSVFWGRDDTQTCRKAPEGLTTGKLCETNSSNAFEKVSGNCKDTNACEIVASNIFFDDNSCGNVYKYLKLCFDCAKI